MTLVELAVCDVEELSESIVQLHALQTAVIARLLPIIAEYDHRQSWRDDGCTSMADWLVAKLSIARRTANDLLALAWRLDEQPAMLEALAGGELSLDQTKAATQLGNLEPQQAAIKTAAQL